MRRPVPKYVPLHGHDWAVLCAEFSHDGTRIITGGEDNIAIIWDVSSGDPLLKLAGHTDSVTCVALSPDGKRALTGSQDNTVKLWDAHTGKEILTLLGHTEEVTSVSFSPDGRTVAHERPRRPNNPLADAALEVSLTVLTSPVLQEFCSQTWGPLAKLQNPPIPRRRILVSAEKRSAPSLCRVSKLAEF